MRWRLIDWSRIEVRLEEVVEAQPAVSRRRPQKGTRLILPISARHGVPVASGRMPASSAESKV